ncbi:MAG: DUF4233 domain-containing protein [Rhodoluna sp.]|jgi:hypothetical protein|nr:DUF4233 domain-containing protein [Rhodoluna sp.]
MRNKSTQRTLGSMLMAFESFVVFFATLVAFGLKVADGPTVWAVGLALSFLFIMTPAILGKKFSYAWGWFLQIVVVALGIWVPLMYVIGGIFVCLWAWAMIAGGTIDKARAVLDRQAEEQANQQAAKEEN